jgi:hypothetical protein
MSKGTAFIHLAPNEVMLKWPPLSEYIGLCLWQLGNTDRLHPLVQFIAFAGVILIYKRILDLWGIKRGVFILSGIFIATTPGIFYQASNTKNDILLGFFLLAFAWSIEEAVRIRKISPLCVAVLGFSLGAAIMTKGTGIIYLAVLMPVMAFRIYHSGTLITVKRIAIISFVVLALSASHYIPHFGDISNGDLKGKREHVNERISWDTALSVFTRNTALQLALPSESWNQFLEKAVDRVDHLIQVDTNGRETTFNCMPFKVIYWPNSEDNATGFLQIFTILIMPLLGGWIIIKNTRSEREPVVWLLFLPVILLAVFSVVFKWQPWHTRLIIPVEIMAGLPFGVIMGRSRLLLRELWVFGALVLLLPCLWGWHRPLFGPQSIFRMDDLCQRTIKVPSAALDIIAASKILHGISPNSITLNESFYGPLVYTGRKSRDWPDIRVLGKEAEDSDVILLSRETANLHAKEGYCRVYDGGAITLDLKESLYQQLDGLYRPDFFGLKCAKGLSEPYGPFPKYDQPIFCNAEYPEVSFTIPPDEYNQLLNLEIMLPLFSNLSWNQSYVYVDGVLIASLRMDQRYKRYHLSAPIPSGGGIKKILIKFDVQDLKGIAASITKIQLLPVKSDRVTAE